MTMRPQRLILISTLILTIPLAPAFGDGEDVRQVLAQRAERSAETAVERRDLAGTPSPIQLFFMTGADNSPVV